MSKPKLLEDLGTLPIGSKGHKKRYGIYECPKCLEPFKAMTSDINRSHTKGCAKCKKTHGLSKHILYGVWNQMVNRCYNEKHVGYKNYGGMGITVCEDWLNLPKFIDDMYSTYSKGLLLDRINLELGYSKENCRWVDACVQSQNTRLLRASNTSGYRGVYLDKTSNMYRCVIKHNNITTHLGYFIDLEEAAKAYDFFVISNNLAHPTNFPKEQYE